MAAGFDVVRQNGRGCSSFMLRGFDLFARSVSWTVAIKLFAFSRLLLLAIFICMGNLTKFAL